MNEHSSRSHAIFIITIECSEVTVPAFYQNSIYVDLYNITTTAEPQVATISPQRPVFQITKHF